MRKKATDIEPGDIIEFLGHPHLITEIAPYNGPYDFISGIARDAKGWGISITDTLWLDVAG